MILLLNDGYVIGNGKRPHKPGVARVFKGFESGCLIYMGEGSGEGEVKMKREGSRF